MSEKQDNTSHTTTYIVRSCDELHTIQAELCYEDLDALVFQVDGERVACFKSWDWWKR